MTKQYNTNIQRLISKYNDLIRILINHVNHYNQKIVKLSNRSPYAKLAGLHKPISIQLLIIPILWTLIVACSNIFQFLLFSLIFIIITIILHSIRSVISNIVDKNFVYSTLHTSQAIKLLILLFSVEIVILLFLPIKVICFGILIIGLIIVYPIMERWNYASQIPLEFVLHLGIFMVWLAVHKCFSFIPVLIYLAAVLWAIEYNTIDRCQYKKSDAKTNIKFMGAISGDKLKKAIRCSYKISISLLGIFGLNANLNLMFFSILGLVLWKLSEQVEYSIPSLSLKKYQSHLKSNLSYGLLILLAFMIGKV